MAEQVAARKESYWIRNYFLLRRLHSMTGLFPVGVFLIMHLVTNSTSVDRHFKQGELFQTYVNRIHSLGSLLPFVEWAFIMLPIIFHALLGLVIWWKWAPNAASYTYLGNIRYTLQRITGGIAFVFILFHVSTLWGGLWSPFYVHEIPGRPDVAYPAFVSAAEALQKAWWVPPVYAIGILASVFHFANGIWTGLITWGVTIGPNAQRVSGILCTGLGVVLAVLGLGALIGFTSADLGQVDRASHGSDRELRIMDQGALHEDRHEGRR